MMILCKTIHTLLGFPDWDIPRRCRNIPPPEKGGLRYVIDDTPPPPPPTEPPKSPDRGDPGAWGLHEAAGPAGGLGLCTESLGSESCDVETAGDIEIAARSPRRKRRPKAERPARERFPPPLPWLSESGGRRSCFMKGERKDGRFLLTEVTIERPEILRASRQDGRLRLQLVDEGSGDDDGDDNEKREEKIREEAEEEERVGVSPVAPMLRCQEAVSGNRNMPMWWSHRFVTTA